jgi:hypothetical protein
MFHRYQIYGLTIASELACPELLAPPTAAPPDCRWRLARLEADLAQASVATVRVQVAPGVYQFLIEGVARYRVQGGEQILIDPVPGADAGDVRLWLLGTALGVLLHQRGLLPLHVSALAMDGAAHAFGGDSGAGKSTLAAALHRRGLPLLTDDVGLAVPTAEAVRFYPGFARIKLWRDALDHFGLDHRALIRDLARTDKFHLRLDAGVQATPLPLRRLYVLERADDDAIRIEPVRGHMAIDLIRAHTYRSGLVHRLGRASDHLRACGQIAQRVRVFRFHRPWRLDRLEASVDALLAHRQED